jgi:predicted transcriptional regulator
MGLFTERNAMSGIKEQKVKKRKKPCDFENLLYDLKNELLERYKNANLPFPSYDIEEIASLFSCDYVDVVKVLLYLENSGMVLIVGKNDLPMREWKVEIQPLILDLIFDKYNF